MSSAPLGSHTVEELIALIAATIAEAPRGEKMPSEVQLMRQYGVSRGVVRHALEKLEARGLITRRQGLGSFVARPYDFFVSWSGASIHEQITAAGGNVRTVKIGTNQVAAEGFIADWLGVEAGTPVIRLERLGYIDGRATNHFSEWFAPGVVTDVSVAARAIESVHDILVAANTQPRRTRCRCALVTPPGGVREQIDLEPGQDAWRVDSLLTDLGSGRPLLVSSNHSRPDTVRMIVEFDLAQGNVSPNTAHE